jgi:type II secretory pathway component GspD/PulD (secretin)
MACISAIAAPPQFTLKLDDGTTTGPFELRDGTVISVGGRKATVTKVKQDNTKLIEKMKNIRIPELDFRQANIRDVIEFLQKSSVKYSTDKKGIPLILRLSHATNDADAQDNTTTPWASEPDDNIETATETLPLITFSALNITLKEALDIVVDIANLKYRATDSTLIIMSENIAEGEIISRLYPVIPHAMSSLMQAARSLADVSRDDDHDETGDFSEITGDADSMKAANLNLKVFFSEMGVEWPEGSSIEYIPAIGKMVVRNTRTNLEVLEKVIKILQIQPVQIEIKVSFVSFDSTQIAALGPGGANLESLVKLWKNGKGTLLAEPAVLTQSGQQATTKGVTECVYPTEFTVVPCSTNTNSVATCSVVEPGSFETREVGAILDVLPELSPNGEMINITLSPELVEPPVWEEYGGKYTDSNGNLQQAHMPQPFFHTYSLQTNIIIEDGYTALISGAMPSRDGKQMVYAFLTANLINIRGKTVNHGISD